MAVQQVIEPSPLGSAANHTVSGLNQTTNTHATVLRPCRWKYHTSVAHKLGLHFRHSSTMLDRVLSLQQSSDDDIDFPLANVQQPQLVKSESAGARCCHACRQTALQFPLRYTLYPREYDWLNRRLYQNRSLYHHAGDLREIKRLHSNNDQYRQKYMAKVLLRTKRNRLRFFSSKCSPLYYHKFLNTGINMEETLLERRGFNIPKMKHFIRHGPEAEKWSKILETEKQISRNFEVQSVRECKMAESMHVAARIAHDHKSHIMLMMPEMRKLYMMDIKSNHRLSSVPSYVFYELQEERELGTRLGNGFVAGDGLERRRSSFPEDPLGEKSTLRMELCVGDRFYAKYHNQTGYDSMASVSSSMFNVVPSGKLPVERDEPQRHE